MIFNDGRFKIYVIKHLYNDNKQNHWSYSGDCYQWIPKKIWLNNSKKIKTKKILEPFSSSGYVWQTTGIHGSSRKEQAFKILDLISKLNPGHRFKVCEIIISQITHDVVEKKHGIMTKTW